jgi:hypothetical protein
MTLIFLQKKMKKDISQRCPTENCCIDIEIEREIKVGIKRKWR